MPSLTPDEFASVVQRERARPESSGAMLAIPVAERLLSDQLTPVLA